MIIKNLFNKIFYKKQSKYIMDKLLGIPKPPVEHICNIRIGNRYFSLINYKNSWIENGIPPGYKIYNNGAVAGEHSCYSLTVIFYYFDFTYYNFNYKPNKRRKNGKIR